MRVTIIESVFGILAFSREDEIIESVLFPKKLQETSRILAEIKAGKLVDEIALLIDKLVENGYDTFIFEDSGLAKIVKEKLNVKVEVAKLSKRGKMLRSMERFAVKTGFVNDTIEFERWMRDVALEMTRLKVKGAVEKKDLIVIQSIQTLDDLDKTVNLFMSRVREWYGIHFPELDRLIDKHETYVRLVYELGNKDNFTDEELEKETIPKSKADTIAKSARTSMGADLTEADLTKIQALCKNVLALYELRRTLEDYLNMVMNEVAPNMKAIVDSLLGARLIALAGGLTNLAKMPASTIQVLGAEKALFRSLKTGTRPPKHGIIFQHATLHEAKKWQRGKIARTIAGKLAIAARVDAFGSRYIGEELKAALDKRVEEIHRKYAQPPEIPARKPRWMKRRKKRASKG